MLPRGKEFKVAEREKGLADRHRVPDRLVCSLRIVVEGGSGLASHHRPAIPALPASPTYATDRNAKPIEVIMLGEAERTSIGEWS
jgi:hypothetical protein